MSSDRVMHQRPRSGVTDVWSAQCSTDRIQPARRVPHTLRNDQGRCWTGDLDSLVARFDATRWAGHMLGISGQRATRIGPRKESDRLLGYVEGMINVTCRSFSRAKLDFQHGYGFWESILSSSGGSCVDERGRSHAVCGCCSFLVPCSHEEPP